MASQTITGDALQYTQDNKHCFAYSGVIIMTEGNETELLSFESDSGFIVAEVVFYYAADSSYNCLYKVKLNNQVVAQYVVGDADSHFQLGIIPLIIPPFTDCSFTGDNITNTSNLSQACAVTGRVYEALPVRN